MILKAVALEALPLYGDGANVRDWLYVENHVDALLLAATQGQLGRSYCVGGHGERMNKEVVEAICGALDDLLPAGAPPPPPGHAGDGSPWSRSAVRD